MKTRDPLKAIHEIWPYLKPWQRKWLRIQCEAIYYLMAGIDWVSRYELYIFPPIAFIADYFWMSRIFPVHPITPFALLATAFMSSTITIFLLRPTKHRLIHWLKNAR